MLRDAGRSEWVVMTVPSLVFALMHATTAFSGQEPALVAATVGFTFGYLDADPGTPVLDLKPYTPSLDRVAHAPLPAWCSGWPADVESAGTFDWSTVLAD